MRQVSNYVSNVNNIFSVNANSLQNAQSTHPDFAMEPKFLLGSSFAIKIAGQPVTLVNFAAMYPGGATEANTSIVATLENLSVASATLGTTASNSITFAVTKASLDAIANAYSQAAGNREMVTIEATIATDSLVTGQFYFQPASGTTAGNWGDILTFQQPITFTSTSAPSIVEIGGGNSSSNAIGLITLNNIRASDNFTVSITASSIDSNAKFVSNIMANNSAAAGA
ncbi:MULTISPECIES: hypothetical protein [unclassified Francisella]|uniref:hypothetical protein n=1 Tax=unclassified Francisella TaxID=2610885 RepID=UPI002E2FD32E|nr:MULTISPECIES: hypothetical protein [unclassified Francisella]MED7818902.1 hypothetical protein [Francisella sp. 19S2-4]MED7829739.1 hypothetical protein [Francisella sp. 19S2-10]